MAIGDYLFLASVVLLFFAVYFSIKFDNAKQAKNMENDLKIFKVTFEEFMAMSEAEQDKLFNEAHEINKENVQKIFNQHPEIDWVTIGQFPPKIISSGKRENEPLEEDSMVLAKEINAVPFVYARPHIVEGG